MSSRYEREIEEILRKTGDARPSVSDRIRAFNQRPPTRLRRSQFRLNNEIGLLIGIILAFLAATLKWIVQTNSGVLGLAASILAIAAFAVIVFTLGSAWIRPRGPQTAWRGQPLDINEGGPRRSPFANLRVRLNLLRMRMSYRNRHR
jgi:hypothetical protein